MKILYHHRTTGRGAEGIHISSMVRAFESLGHEVVILSPPGINPLSNVGQKPLDKSEGTVSGMILLWKLISKYAPQIVFEFLELIYNFKAILRMRRIIRETGTDIIYERNAYFLFAGAYVAKLYNIPLLVEANEVVGIRRARKLRLKILAAMIERYTFSRSRAILVVSSFLARKAEMVVDGKVPVCVIPNAVDPVICEKKTKRDELRQNFRLENKIVIGFAGWFDWWDRLDLLLDLHKRILEAGRRDVVTMLIGDGPVMKELKGKRQTLGIEDSVIFTGPVDRIKIIDYIDMLDIGALAHSNEFGSPVVLFEMMARAKPVVGPSLMPLRDVIVHNQNGLLFNPLDTDALFNNTLMLVDSPVLRSRLGDAARHTVRDCHTWARNAEKALSMLAVH
jgi:glycosyltransferase involved in cell wall biosynthesis